MINNIQEYGLNLNVEDSVDGFIGVRINWEFEERIIELGQDGLEDRTIIVMGLY